jgi:transcriptional regulator with XRE-family HTH domain
MKKRNSSKAPTKQDTYLGERIREARIASGISQKDLGEMLGVSYQQIQKYEDGHNRVNGGRIGRLVTALNRPLDYFFPGATDVRATAEPAVSQFLASKDGRWIAERWFRMSQPARSALRGVVSELVKEQDHG